MNPFRYSEPVPSNELIDRDTETRLLLRRAMEGNNSRLVAPRRYGKTSLLRRVTAQAEAEGFGAVYVDFFGVLTLADIGERIERAYAAQLRGPAASWFSGARRMLRPTFRAGGGPVPVSAEVTLGPQAEPPLVDRLALPTRLHERDGTRTLVVFDEFQDVLTAHDRVDATIRSEIQHHGDAASYIFAGSQLGMMRELFSDRRRAFYGQAGPVDLHPLAPDDVAAHLTERFRRTDRDIGQALDPLLAVARGHPQRTMLLAHAVWDQIEPGEVADEGAWRAAYDQVMREVGDELRTIWTSLSASHRRALTAIAENDAPLYGAARRHGGSRGGTVQAAVAALGDRGEIVEDRQTVTGYRAIDPLLAAWINGGRPGI